MQLNEGIGGPLALRYGGRVSLWLGCPGWAPFSSPDQLAGSGIVEVWSRRDRQMENKPAQNIQDSFLNTARKDKTNITIYLLSGVKLNGRIRSFDKYSVVLETNNQEQLIFKHAISTVVMGKSASHVEPRPSASAHQAGGGSAGAPGSSTAAAPSGTEG
jgi:host factor-I protein